MTKRGATKLKNGRELLSHAMVCEQLGLQMTVLRLRRLCEPAKETASSCYWLPYQIPIIQITLARELLSKALVYEEPKIKTSGVLDQDEVDMLLRKSQ